ncbi:hypothetical protein K504DRAFT_506366 [Pleomassaria siparia CBS 279.74]|uniref:Nudix hydrolase domain-containing protein n=1 Tax=Pleomassaria siparia CBS 279.74 TaxID=1314801 RepID=A0A6G1JWM3_9PLEO|nr:hypothetical protein K504DRAFT_506366 [Pleomassaria siparia CBS 279.74]
MTTFTLEGFRNPVVVTLTTNVTKDQLLGFRPFKVWKDTLQSNLALQYIEQAHAFGTDPFTIRSIEVQSVDWFGKRIGFVKLKAVISNRDGRNLLPGTVYLRGGYVAMLIILRPSDARDERMVIMTEQPRVAVGSLGVFEIPTGMLDDTGIIRGAAAIEIEEETGFKLPLSELIDMTELALHDSKIPERSLQNAMYPSPGGSDECVPIFLWEKELDRQEIEDLRDKLMGKRAQGEMMGLRVCDYEDLWREGARDAKTLAAWALYEGLSRSGDIQNELNKRRNS